MIALLTIQELLLQMGNANPARIYLASTVYDARQRMNAFNAREAIWNKDSVLKPALKNRYLIGRVGSAFLAPIIWITASIARVLLRLNAQIAWRITFWMQIVWFARGAIWHVRLAVGLWIGSNASRVFLIRNSLTDWKILTLEFALLRLTARTIKVHI